MKRMKLLCVLVVIILLTGCIRMETNMEVTSDGRLQVERVSLINVDAGLNDSDESLGNMEDFSPDFTIREYSEDGWEGIVAYREYNIHEVSGTDPILVDIAMLGHIGFDDSQLFQALGNDRFRATFIFENPELDELEEDMDLTELRMIDSMMDFTFSMTLPSEAINHNADRVEGRTLIWDLSLVEAVNIDFEFSLVETDDNVAEESTEEEEAVETEEESSNMLLYVIIAAIAAGIVIALVVNQKKKANNMQQFNQQSMMGGQIPPAQTNPQDNQSVMQQPSVEQAMPEPQEQSQENNNNQQ